MKIIFSQRLSLFFLLCCIAMVMAFSGCATVYNPATQQKEFIFISTAQEVELGKNASREITQDLDISNDWRLQERVSSIGEKVAAVSHRKDLTYTFSVVNDQAINAFAVPGGFVYVNTGLLALTNDDELACVLAHEVGHIAARHSVKALQATLGYNLLTALFLSKEEYGSVVQAGNFVFNVVHLKYSREDELTADRLGIEYAYWAGFDPQGMVSFFKKLQAQQKEKGSSQGILFLRSHPYIEQRIDAAKKEIDLL